MIHTFADRISRHEEVRLHRSCFGLTTDLSTAKEIDASVMCDLEEPWRQRAVVIEGIELALGLKERLLNDVFTIHYRTGHARAIWVKAETQVGNRFEEHEVAGLKWTADIKAGWIVHIDITQTEASGIRAEQKLLLANQISNAKRLCCSMKGDGELTLFLQSGPPGRQARFPDYYSALSDENGPIPQLGSEPVSRRIEQNPTHEPTVVWVCSSDVSLYYADPATIGNPKRPPLNNSSRSPAEIEELPGRRHSAWA